MKRSTLWLGGALGVALLALALSTRPAHAALHHAALVIQHSSGRVVTRCVGFVEDRIAGLQLIQRSGIQYKAQTFGSIGTAICQLDNEPSSVPSSCFGSGPYWQYSHRTSSGWQPSAVAASIWQVQDGDMDGWRYAQGAAQTPPALGFATVCNPPAAASAVQQASSAPAIARAAPTKAAAPTITIAPSPGASLQALAPTPSPTPRAALAVTGPSPPPAQSSPIGIWLALVAAVGLLTALGALNLLRRRQ